MPSAHPADRSADTIGRGTVKVLNEKAGMYCDRCDRAVIAVPAELAQVDRRGVPRLLARVAGRIRATRDSPEWRCPRCLGPVHEGTKSREGSAKRWLARAGGLMGFGAFGLAVVQDGPATMVGPLAFGAGFVALVIALQSAERLPLKAAEPRSPDEWLEDARASYARGTHISTLAVRYDVEPEWLEEQLRPAAGAGR